MKMKTSMKLSMKTALFLFTLTIFGPQATHAGGLTETLVLPKAELQLDSAPFWVRQWSLNEVKGISLKTVTNYDSALLMTFSGADYTYLNQMAATSFKATAANTFEWMYSDANVDYKRNYEVKDGELYITVGLQFKTKAPEKAFLNIVSHGAKDDPEARDRELFYYSNSKIERNAVNKEIDSTTVMTPVKWVGAGSRYFVFAVIPDGTPAEKLLMQTTSPLNAQASLQFPVVNNQINARFKVIFVPKRLDVLRKIDPTLDTTVNLGFFTFLAYPILWTLKYIYNIPFVHNYGVAIIILTLLIKALTFPLVLKSMKSMRKMAEFQPKMKALQEKHKSDKETLNREMMAMMKGSGYNPMAGCLPMILQMPIFFALYSVLYAAVELYHEPFLYLADLSAKDPYYATPILMTLVMFLQQRLTPPAPGMDPAQRKVMMFMPLMFGAFMLTTPSGLCVYMLVNATVSVIQQQYLNKKLGVPGHAAGMATSF